MHCCCGLWLITCRMMIYFDGYLPPSKLSTRLGRLTQQSNRLSQYHQLNPTPCRASFARQKMIPPALFDAGDARRQLTNLSPLPFLVPSVIEALTSSSRYCSMVEVVPGEADIYCAKYLKKHGGLVLTSDSDLLVHDVGLRGGIAFFEDIEESPVDGPDALKARIYRPTTIVQRLSLPKEYGISALAFEMVLDPSAGLPDVLLRAQSFKHSIEKNPAYERFILEYTPLSDHVTPDGEKTGPVLSILQRLDPRISEFVLQLPRLAQIAGQSRLIGAPEVQIPHIFLPFLADNPVLTNAWEISTAVRQLAYGLVNLIVPKSQQN